MSRSRFFALILMVALGTTISFAQTSRGTITGTVTDPSGAVVSDATVTITSGSTALTQTAKTNSVGIYRFEAVLLGDYTITVEAAGFGKATSKVSVNAGLVSNRDIGLKLGNSADTVTVEATAPDLQTEEAVRSTAIDSVALARLPITGQNSLTLMLTLPGVVRSNQGGSLDSGIGSVNGARARSNNFMIDGTQNNDISVAGPSFVLTNNDAIQEVSMQTSNFTAEFGRSGGAIINQVLKSGGNSYHGTAAWIYRSELFNASNRTQRVNFANGGTTDVKNKFKENIPAFTFGGPVVLPKLYDGRGKTFFFVAGQWDRYSANNSTTFSAVPTEAGVATLSPLAASCPNLASFLGLLGPARGTPGTGSANISIALPSAVAASSCGGGQRTGQLVQVGQYVRNNARVVLDNNHQVKVDHRVSDRQNMSFRWLWDSNNDTDGNTGINPAFDIPFRGKTMSGTFNDVYSITNNAINEFRFSYTRFNYGWFFDAPASLGATTPDIQITSLSSLAVSSTFPQGRIANSWQYQDTVGWSKGRHSMRFGAEFLRQLAKQVAPFNGRGIVQYSSSASNAFTGGAITGLANFIDNFSGTNSNPVQISFGSGLYRPNLFTYAFFAQDSWKVRHDLTVNLGLRYENFGQPANIFKYPAFVGYADADILSSQKVNNDNNNFAPSVGFAYNPAWKNGFAHFFSGDGKLVIRGGYQVSYDTWFNNLLSNMAAGSPNALSNTATPGVSNGATPRGRANLSAILPTLVPVAVTPYSNQTNMFDKNIRNPYYHRISLGFQRELPSSMVMELAYVGTLGRQLFFTNPLNPAVVNATGDGSALQPAQPGCPSPCLQRVFSNRGLIQIRDSGLTSNYNAMQLQVRRKYAQTPLGGMTFSSSYTWSRSMDVLSETFATNSSGQNPSRSPVFGPLKSIDYAPSDNDRRHAWVTAMHWDVRGPKHGFFGQVFGGWAVAPIITVQSGTPFTVLNGFDRDLDGSSLGDRPDIGNWNAPINTRARVVAASVCPTGLQNPAVGTAAGAGCVTANDVRFVQVTAYSPTSPNMAGRNAFFTTGMFQMDANILKTFNLSERFKFEYRAEIFNVTNNENLNTPLSAASNNRNITSAVGTNFLNYDLVNYNGINGTYGGINGNSDNRGIRMGLKVIF